MWYYTTKLTTGAINSGSNNNFFVIGINNKTAAIKYKLRYI